MSEKFTYEAGRAYRWEELPSLVQGGGEFCAEGNGMDDITAQMAADDRLGHFVDGYILARDGVLELADGGTITLA